MAWIIVGLGNPGDEYECTRHNAGRRAAEHFVKAAGLSDWKEDKKPPRSISRGMMGKDIVVAVLPETFMNKSGAAVSPYIKSVKAAQRLLVAYDDLDLPIGAMKISFDRGSGGHKGLESVARALKTTKFARVRIGISPATASGQMKKPHGEKEVEKFILGAFRPSEEGELKAVFKRASAAIECIIREGIPAAMNRFN